nr:PREDICTED: esterase FE4-like [Bemisia tabaci]
MKISMCLKLFLVFASGVFTCSGLEVSTPNGKIIGFDTLKTRNGRVIHSFTGIPFAKPPIGLLRFKEPQPLESWKKPLDATKNASFCPQIDLFNPKMKSSSQVLGKEDCLVLNVYSPNVNKAAKLPVMVFIHGGGYQQGSSVIYGPELLLDKDIVLVTVNYRLGALGFLSTGDGVIPANNGLKDQALAIKWVHDNIENFGGNPGLVTVFGESAGGASVHLNLLSPLNKGLIHRGIAMSGTGHCPWAIINPQLAKDRTKALAVLCGCPSEPSDELLKCMQEVHPESLLEMSKRFQDWALAPAVVFGPTIESGAKGDFLPKDVDDLESKVPLMTGVTSGEGGLAASIIFSAGGKPENELKENPQYILPKILMLRSEFPKDKVPSVSKQIQKFYFGEKSIDTNSTEEIINLFTDSWFLHGAAETARKYKGEAYFYVYDYLHSVSHNSLFGNTKIQGVSHSDDLLDLFPLTYYFPKRTWPEADVKVSRKTIDIVTDFAKNGKLSDTSLKWEPIGKAAKTRHYLHITAAGPAVKENLFSKRVDFWQSLILDTQSEKKI